ncbi:MAG: hypothetical protein ACTSQV_08765 [Alphaproteobacteria bacterium]
MAGEKDQCASAHNFLLYRIAGHFRPGRNMRGEQAAGKIRFRGLVPIYYPEGVPVFGIAARRRSQCRQLQKILAGCREKTFDIAIGVRRAGSPAAFDDRK